MQEIKTKNSWNFRPFVEIGIFQFGDHYEKYRNLLEPWNKKDEVDDSITFYIVNTDSFLSADENGRIKDVTCKNECNYKDENLISKSLEKVESILQFNAVYDDQMCEQEIYNIDELGLMLWVDKGIVVTVNCGIYIDPDEV